jgi:hypothetical protein
MLSLTSLFSASGVPNSEQVSGIADSGLPRRTSRMMSSPQVRRELASHSRVHNLEVTGTNGSGNT